MRFRLPGRRILSRPLRLFGVWGFFGLLAMLAPPLPAARAEPPAAAAVLDAFGRIAFGNEYVAEADPRLRKWVKPVRWRAYEAVELTPAERAFLGRHIARLTRLTGLAFIPAETWPETDLIVYFVSETRYASAIERYLDPGRHALLPRLVETACLGLLRHHRDTHEIQFAIAIIPVERARRRGLVQSCIAEETTQVLGLVNDADDIPDTLFNDKGAARDLTALDEAMLRLLYDPRLKPGMRRAEAMAAARDVLGETARPPGRRP